MTQQETAERLEAMTGRPWSNATVSAAERFWKGGRTRRFDADELVAFSMCFDVPIQYFFLAPDDAPYDMRANMSYDSDPHGTSDESTIPYSIVLQVLLGDALTDRGLVEFEHRVNSTVSRFLGPGLPPYELPGVIRKYEESLEQARNPAGVKPIRRRSVEVERPARRPREEIAYDSLQELATSASPTPKTTPTTAAPSNEAVAEVLSELGIGQQQLDDIVKSAVVDVVKRLSRERGDKGARVYRGQVDDEAPRSEDRGQAEDGPLR